MNEQSEQWRITLNETRRALNAELGKLRAQIADREQKIAFLVSERDRITRRLSEGRTFKPSGRPNSQKDDWLVSTVQLGPIIEKWIDAYNTEHDGGAYLTLSMMSEVSSRTIRRICKGQFDTVTISTADMLLTAIGKPEELNKLKLFPARKGRYAPKPPDSHYYEE